MKKPATNKKKQRNNALQALSYFSQIGFTIASCVLIGVFLGMFLDNRLGTSPWLLLIFSLLGTGAAFSSLLKFVKGKED